MCKIECEQERKAAIREHVWVSLEAAGAAPAGVRGRIPDFFGSEKAANRLTGLPDWQQARTVQANRQVIDEQQAQATGHRLGSGHPSHDRRDAGA
jgi:hypothetical protein